MKAEWDIEVVKWLFFYGLETWKCIRALYGWDVVFFGIKEAASQAFQLYVRHALSHFNMSALPTNSLAHLDSSRFRVILFWARGKQNDCECTLPEERLDHSKCSFEEWGGQVHPPAGQGHAQVLQGSWGLQWGKVESICLLDRWNWKLSFWTWNTQLLSPTSWLSGLNVVLNCWGVAKKKCIAVTSAPEKFIALFQSQYSHLSGEAIYPTRCGSVGKEKPKHSGLP